MLLNIFSSFDPMWTNLCYGKSSTIIIPAMLLLTSFWMMDSNITTSTKLLISYILEQLAKTTLKHLKMSLLVNSSLFILIIYMNLTGLLPYLFSISSHIIFTLSMGLPMWAMLIISSMTYMPKKMISHMLPDSAPMWLNPFLVIIESVSITVRPMTLSFRLAANMTAGHIVLMLMSSFSISIMLKNFILITTMSMLYIIFEMGICMIQAYIFCLLISLYSNDHPCSD